MGYHLQLADKGLRVKGQYFVGGFALFKNSVAFEGLVK